MPPRKQTGSTLYLFRFISNSIQSSQVILGIALWNSQFTKIHLKWYFWNADETHKNRTQGSRKMTMWRRKESRLSLLTQMLLSKFRDELCLGFWLCWLTSSIKFPISSGLAGRGRYWGILRRVGATSLRVTSGRASRPLCNWLRSKSFGENGKRITKSKSETGLCLVYRLWYWIMPALTTIG